MDRLLLLMLVLASGCEFTVKFTSKEPPKTKKVLRQVRPWTQIEGMIDDGMEWVEVPIDEN